MNNYFIILASGQSKRFNSVKPKQFIKYKNKALFEHSIDKALNSKLFKKIILVINDKKQIKYKYPKNVIVIKGGKERSDSSLLGLKYIKKFKPNNVLIHDAARPNFTIKLLNNLINSLKKNKASIPAITSKDSIKYKVKNQLFNLKRENSFLTQTPQAFRFNDLYKLAISQKTKIQDEATLFIENNLKVKFIQGENLNTKIEQQMERINKKVEIRLDEGFNKTNKSKVEQTNKNKEPKHFCFHVFAMRRCTLFRRAAC